MEYGSVGRIFCAKEAYYSVGGRTLVAVTCERWRRSQMIFVGLVAVQWQ